MKNTMFSLVLVVFLSVVWGTFVAPEPAMALDFGTACLKCAAADVARDIPRSVTEIIIVTKRENTERQRIEADKQAEIARTAANAGWGDVTVSGDGTTTSVKVGGVVGTPWERMSKHDDNTRLAEEGMRNGCQAVSVEPLPNGGVISRTGKCEKEAVEIERIRAGVRVMEINANTYSSLSPEQIARAREGARPVNVH